jgi:hypothetical protein
MAENDRSVVAEVAGITRNSRVSVETSLKTSCEVVYDDVKHVQISRIVFDTCLSILP